MCANKFHSELTRAISNLVITNIRDSTIREDAYEEGYWDLNDIHIYIREDILDNGKTLCNTRSLANLYAYSYILVHVDAFKAILTTPPVDKVFDELIVFGELYFQDYENCLIVDIGCGPGTFGLALAELWMDEDEDEDEDFPENLPINYLGIDIEPQMVLLAEDFFNSPLFDDRVRIQTSDCRTRIRVDNGIKPTKLIFTFNYIFSQTGILEAIEEFIKIIKDTLIEYPDIQDIYLFYSNIDFVGERSAFTVFLNRLKEENLLDEDHSMFIPKYEYNFRKFNRLEGDNIDLFEGTQRYVYSRVFELSRP
ncbi:class I SAM-dependent methyltransferase [Acinetobacter baumannii]|nr:class I SAM-dependent methyltransferase [Acinetobacter baumannii]